MGTRIPADGGCGQGPSPAEARRVGKEEDKKQNPGLAGPGIEGSARLGLPVDERPDVRRVDDAVAVVVAGGGRLVEELLDDFVDATGTPSGCWA